MFTHILWRFLILETFVMGALCAFCFYEHPQKVFCTSELVLQAKFLESKRVAVGYNLRMEIITFYKGEYDKMNIMRGRQIIVKVRSQIPEPGSVNIIFGRIRNGMIYTNTCNGIMPRENMSEFQINTFNRYFKIKCDCVHKLGNYTWETDCYWYHSVIKRNDKNECVMIHNSYVSECEHRNADEPRWICQPFIHCHQQTQIYNELMCFGLYRDWKNIQNAWNQKWSGFLDANSVYM